MPPYRGSAACYPGQLLRKKKNAFGGKNLLHNTFLVIWYCSQVQTSCTNPGGVWLELKQGGVRVAKTKRGTNTRLLLLRWLTLNVCVSTSPPVSALCRPASGRVLWHAAALRLSQCRNKVFDQKMRFEEGVWRETWRLLFFVSVLHQRLEEWHSPLKCWFDAEQELKSTGGDWFSHCLAKIFRNLIVNWQVLSLYTCVSASLSLPRSLLYRKSCCWRKYSFIEAIINYW